MNWEIICEPNMKSAHLSRIFRTLLQLLKVMLSKEDALVSDDSVHKETSPVEENSSPKSSINEPLAPMMSQLVFKCGSCSFSAPLNRSLKTRIETNHPTQKSENTVQVKCEVCNYRCNDHDAVLDHIKSTHIKSKLLVSLLRLQHFPCKKCKFTSTKKASLRDHVAHQHPST